MSRHVGAQVGAHVAERLRNGLYVVGTPIGNMDDLTLRAISVLRSSDIILCENTNIARGLLRRHRLLADNRVRLLSYHDPTGGLPRNFRSLLQEV